MQTSTQTQYPPAPSSSFEDLGYGRFQWAEISLYYLYQRDELPPTHTENSDYLVVTHERYS